MGRVEIGSLKPGDHIYAWCAAYTYIQHGIYVGNDRVIHFTRRRQEIGTGNYMDYLPTGSKEPPCATCFVSVSDDVHGVVSSCLNCFLAVGFLYRFEYTGKSLRTGVTYPLEVSDDNDMVVHRSNYLFNNGLNCYNIFKYNCEDFAIYCKTGLLVLDQATLGEAVSIIGIRLGYVLTLPSRIVDVDGMVANAVKVSVEDLTTRLAEGTLQVVANRISIQTNPNPEENNVSFVGSFFKHVIQRIKEYL